MRVSRRGPQPSLHSHGLPALGAVLVLTGLFLAGWLTGRPGLVVVLTGAVLAVGGLAASALCVPRALDRRISSMVGLAGLATVSVALAVGPHPSADSEPLAAGADSMIAAPAPTATPTTGAPVLTLACPADNSSPAVIAVRVTGSGPFQLTLDFGDGLGTATPDLLQAIGSGSVIEIPHVFSTPGPHSVTGSATDSTGRTASGSCRTGASGAPAAATAGTGDSRVGATRAPASPSDQPDGQPTTSGAPVDVLAAPGGAAEPSSTDTPQSASSPTTSGEPVPTSPGGAGSEPPVPDPAPTVPADPTPTDPA